MEHAQNINQLLDDVKVLREPTTAEILVEKVGEVGVADFYVDAKNEFLTEVGKQPKGLE